MDEISTTAKGDKFEDEVFQIISNLLSNDELFLPKKFSKVFKKKPYYSRDREKNIITDISIETTLPNADKYSILTIIECKGYPKNTVQVDEIEEFASKLSQITGHNAKGIMITSSRYAEGCINYARNKGIGLIRIIEEEIIYDIHRTSRFGEYQAPDNAKSVLLGETTPQRTQYIIDNKSFEDIPSYLIHLNIIDKKPSTEHNKLRIPYLSSHDIDNMCNDIISEHQKPNQLINLDHIIDVFNLKLITNQNLGIDNGKEILGSISLKDNSISISNKLEYNSHRWRFTLAHELGHYFLHTKLLSNKFNEIIDTDYSIDSSMQIDNQTIKRIEYQANMFARSILMPSILFKAVTHLVFLQNSVNRGRIYLDHQPCNQQLFYIVANKISETFNVSIQAVRYRLSQFELLEDTTKNSFRDIFDKLY